MPPSSFCSGYFEIGSCFLPGQGWTTILLFLPAPTVAGMKVMWHHAQLFLLRWGLKTFCPADLELQSSQVARITGMTHYAWLLFFLSLQLSIGPFIIPCIVLQCFQNASNNIILYDPHNMLEGL
jgi:hypothetical protein